MGARFHLDLDFAPDRCEYLYGEGLLAELGARIARFVRSPRAVLVTDEHLAGARHAKAAETSLESAGFHSRTLVVAAGEGSKSVDGARGLWEAFAEAKLPADGVVIALGGGVVGDLAGFCAATWMRGVTLVQVPTTLLSMCDSAIGGKTAIDLPAGKNLVGAFHQPRLVLSDPDTLATLPERDMRSGAAEIVKCALLRDRATLWRLGESAGAILAREPAALEMAVRLAVEVKADHVRGDVRDASGRRVLLNLGHTVGHAIEAETGYGAVLHGEAVAAGLMVAARLSVRRGIAEEDLVASTREVLDAFELPVALPAGVSAGRILARTELDKKRRAGLRRMVLPSARGGAGIYDVDDAELLAALTG